MLGCSGMFWAMEEEYSPVLPQSELWVVVVVVVGFEQLGGGLLLLMPFDIFCCANVFERNKILIQ